MVNNIFDLFGIDFDDLYQKFLNLQNTLTEKYNDLLKNAKKYDLNTDEGYENFIKDCADLRKELESRNDSVFNDYMIKILDKCVKDAMDNHNAKKLEKKESVSELVNAEVNRAKKEHHCRCEAKKPSEEKAVPDVKTIERPSSKLNYKQTTSIWNLVDEYMDTVIAPNLNASEEVLESVADSLFEFAAWLLEKED